uniref:Uncharacterized protein n=1 Tax=Romanomermis culicivorax TaxID=13658 RepID=A0A915KYI5_ROMCU
MNFPVYWLYKSRNTAQCGNEEDDADSLTMIINTIEQRNFRGPFYDVCMHRHESWLQSKGIFFHID